MTGPAVILNNVVKRYSLTKALDGVNLTIDHGKVVGLLGHNGSGKTTMLKIIAGLRRPTSGRWRSLGWHLGCNQKKGCLCIRGQHLL